MVFIYLQNNKKEKGAKEDTFFTDTCEDDVEFINAAEGVLHSTHVTNILHSIFSNAALYIKNHQIHNSNALSAHKSHISNTFKITLTDHKGVLLCEGYDYEEDPENLLECSSFTRRIKLYSRPDGFMFYDKLDIDFLTTSELLYPNMKVRIKLIRAPPNSYKIS